MHTADAYQRITDHIVTLLETGTVPWHKPWNAETGMPKNLASGKPYRGINIFMLGTQHYTSPWWLTFKQCKDRGGRIKKGGKSTPVVFWKVSEYTSQDTDSGEEEIRKGFLLRYYNVFNVEQCEGIEYPPTEIVHNDIQPIDACERIVVSMPDAPVIADICQQAFYSPGLDIINMPPRYLFSSAEEYYSTLFHELTHSTGHEKRLNRKSLADIMSFGDTNYSKEELCAEMGAAYLCGIAGIENRTIDNSAAYIDGWLSKLRHDPKVLVQAAAQAQKAVDSITSAA